MKVSTRIETKETEIFETETHVMRTTQEVLNKIMDGSEHRKKMYEYISGKMHPLKTLSVDSGMQRDVSRDAIYRHIMDNDEPPYKLKEMQMVLTDVVESKDAPNVAAMKEKKAAKA